MSAVDQIDRVTALGVTPRRRRRPWHPDLSGGASLLLLLPILVVAGLFLAYPIIKLTIDSVTTGDGFGNYVAVFSSGASRRAIGTTLLSAALVMVISIALAAPVAWFLRATRRRTLRSIVWVSILVPFCMGVVIKNYALAIILSRNGIANEVLMALGITDQPVQLMYTTFAVILGMVYAMLPFAVLSLYAAFTTIDPALLAAARSLGASRVKAATSVIVPLGWPGFVASATIVFAISIGFYVTPVVLGGVQSPFLATLINNDLFHAFDYPRAAASSVLLLGIALVLLLVSLRFVGGKRLKEALG